MPAAGTWVMQGVVHNYKQQQNEEASRVPEVSI
jgi:hypothetical protein